MDEEYFTIEEMAKLLRLSRKTLYKWAEQGKFSTVKLCEATIRVPRSALDEIITHHPKNAIAGSGADSIPKPYAP